MGKPWSKVTPLSGSAADSDSTLIVRAGKNYRTTLATFLAGARDRATHIGSQAIATVTGLQSALNTLTAADTTEATARAAAVTAEASSRAAGDATLTTNVATNASAIAAETTRATAAEGLKLAKASNLSDVANAATALANLGGQAAIPPGTYVPINGDGMGGATASDQLLKDWAAAEAYEVTAATRDVNDLVTTAAVKWPDGSGGTFTTTTANATFLTVDAYTVSHTLSGKTVTQTAVTRNSNGAVTAKPALTVA